MFLSRTPRRKTNKKTGNVVMWKSILWGNAVVWALSAVWQFYVFTVTAGLSFLLNTVAFTLASLFFILLVEYHDDEEE